MKEWRIKVFDINSTTKNLRAINDFFNKHGLKPGEVLIVKQAEHCERIHVFYYSDRELD